MPGRERVWSKAIGEGYHDSHGWDKAVDVPNGAVIRFRRRLLNEALRFTVTSNAQQEVH